MVILAPGDCSPSLKVVSKINTRFVISLILSLFAKKFHSARIFSGKLDSERVKRLKIKKGVVEAGDPL
jgi:hypothetical protein